jgi:hypothetical protein
LIEVRQQLLPEIISKASKTRLEMRDTRRSEPFAAPHCAAPRRGRGGNLENEKQLRHGRRRRHVYDAASPTKDF